MITILPDLDLEHLNRGLVVLNPDAVTFEASCKTGEGIPAGADWLVERVAEHRTQT